MIAMLYTPLLYLHSWNRWIVLISALVLVAMGIAGWMRGSNDATLLKKLSVIFIISLDIQFLTGLVLFFVAPTSHAFLGDTAAGMGDSVLRFWGLEHPFGMFLGLVFAHVGRARIRRAETAAGASRAAAIWIGLGLVFMLATIPWPGLPQGRPLIRL